MVILSKNNGVKFIYIFKKVKQNSNLEQITLLNGYFCLGSINYSCYIKKEKITRIGENFLRYERRR